MFGNILEILSVSWEQVISVLIAFGVVYVIYALRDLIVERTLAAGVERIRYVHFTKKVTRDFVIKDFDCDLLNYVKFGCLFVRFGHDEIVKDLQGALRKDADRKIRDIDANPHCKENELRVSFDIRVHKDLGVQFKCWVETVEEYYDKLLETVRLLKEESNRKTIALIDDPELAKKVRISPRLRIYFIVKDFREVTTPEGFTNNFIYPK
jgi:hypothetical protein